MMENETFTGCCLNSVACMLWGQFVLVRGKNHAPGQADFFLLMLNFRHKKDDRMARGL